MLQLEEKFKDYYSYVNKEWFKTYDLPDEYSRISTFEIISKQIKDAEEKKKKEEDEKKRRFDELKVILIYFRDK